MTVQVPELDTIDFEALIAEVRSLIPRYAPEWTDHNAHDPGITVLELLAWITDQQIYQLGLVGPRHHAAFARLLGVEPQPARPARGVIWPFAPVAIERQLPRGTAIKLIEEPDLGFAFDLALRLSAARRTSLEAVGHGLQLELLATERQDRASFPLGWLPLEGDRDIRLSLDRPLATDRTSGEPTAVISVGIEIESPEVDDPYVPADDLPSWGPLRFEYRVEPGDWLPVPILRDDTVNLLRSGIVALEVPVTVSGPRDQPRSQLRLRLDGCFLPHAPRIARMRHNALPVVQLEPRPEAVIGTGNGLPNQALELERAAAPSIPLGRSGAGYIPDPASAHDPLAIEVATGGRWEPWFRVIDLARALPDDAVYRLDPKTRSIHLGNGVNGRIPDAGAQIRHRQYQLTSGSAGNVRANLHWQVPGAALAGTDAWRNTGSFRGGADPWDERRLSVEARRRARKRDLALRDDHLRELLLALPGFDVVDAAIRPRTHPNLPGQPVAGHRTAVVVPAFLGREPPPEPAHQQRYRDMLARRVAAHRPLGEGLSVVLATKAVVTVRARLLTELAADRAKIRREAGEALDSYLPRPTHPPGAIAPRPLPGQTVRIAKVMAILARIEGVVAIDHCELASAARPFAPRDLEMPSPTALAVGQVDGHEIELRATDDPEETHHAHP